MAPSASADEGGRRHGILPKIFILLPNFTLSEIRVKTFYILTFSCIVIKCSDFLEF